MGKYEPLQRHLEGYSTDNWSANFADIEKVLGFELPPSARTTYAWWANEKSGSHSQARSWQQAGWRTRDVDIGTGQVRFERINRREPATSKPIDGHAANLGALAPMLKLAATILKIDDHTEILRLALDGLIRRSVDSELASLAGAMPDLRVPQRERPAA